MHELPIPLMQTVEIGGSGARQCAHEVHRGRRVRISANHSCGIVTARFFSRFYTVDNVTAVAEQPMLIYVGRTRFGILSGDTRELHHWGGRSIGQYHGHLQQSLDVTANVWLG